MARPSLELIQAIRHTARRLKQQAPYQWGHMGSCNCGHLAQEITKLSSAEIHRAALYNPGDWTEQSRVFATGAEPSGSDIRVSPLKCPYSGLSMDVLIQTMLDFGLEIQDLEYLEKLSDPNVLKYLKARSLRHNQRDHVVRYMQAWAELLEIEMISAIPVEDLKKLVRNAQIHS